MLKFFISLQNRDSTTMKMDLFCILETLAEDLIRIETIRCPTDHNRELIPRPMPTAVFSRLSVMDLTPL